MRQEPERDDLLEAEGVDVEASVGVDLGVERPRRVTPALAKAIAYRRDRYFVSEYPHAERKSWPKKKALRNQTHRRQVDRALRPAFGTVTPELDDFAPAMPRRPRSPSRHMHGNIPLGEWVDSKLEKRLAFVGRNIDVKIGYRRYWRRLVPFLESLVAGRRGHSVELARRFGAVLDDLANPDRFRRVGRRFRQNPIIWPNPRWHRAIRELIDKQPEWEARLRAWIAEVVPSAPPAEEPAWRRIRRLRARSGR